MRAERDLRLEAKGRVLHIMLWYPSMESFSRVNGFGHNLLLDLSLCCFEAILHMRRVKALAGWCNSGKDREFS
jgi:hypothetical protein